MRGQGMRNGRFGVKTGLAARKMALWKGVSPLNRSPLGVRNLESQWSPFRRRTNISRRLGFSPSPKSNYFNSSYSQATTTFRRGMRMNQQRDKRQATFFQKRGIKVQATMDMDQHEELPELTRTYPISSWRTSMNSSGILTVSIDNPAAAPLPSMRLPRPPLPFLLKEGSEPKIPKGVPLDFDINSVVKQTGITLNERFKILKEQRLSQAISKGSRFVTVG
ncbi:UAP56-interacting factor [Hyperolius riggenbachi]|uniref:UAP56-interacting factor n=1 Tax=Hyperolius riggenbachi TaxID=752182 RepID=UPI0035A2B230